MTKFIPAFLACVSVIVTASPQVETSLPLQYFEDLALVRNPTVQQAAAVERQFAGQARQAGLYPNPVAGYQGEQIRGGSRGGGEHGGFLQQTIPLGGKLGLRRDVFEQQRRSGEIGIEEQRRRVLSEVGQAFYAALSAQELVDARVKLLQLTLDALQTARQLANVGQADLPDVLQSEVEAEQAKVDLNTAQLALAGAFRTLAAVSGDASLPMARLAGNLYNLPELDTANLTAAILRDSPAVKRAQQDVAAAEAAVKSARRESLPDLQLRAGVQQSFEPLDGLPRRSVGVQAFASAGITLPIFNRNQGNVDAARAGVERARGEVTRTRLSIERAGQSLIQTYLSQKLQSTRYRDEMLPRAQKAYELYLAKYQQMGAAYQQVIVSQRTLFQLRAAYIRTLGDLWSNSVRLNHFLLTGGLDAPGSVGLTTGLNLPSGGGPVTDE